MKIARLVVSSESSSSSWAGEEVLRRRFSSRSTSAFLTGPSRCGTQEMPSLVTTAATHGASKRMTGLAPSREKPSDQRRGPRPAAPGRRRVKDHPNPSHTNPAADRLIRPQRARINRSRQGRRTSSPFPSPATRVSDQSQAARGAYQLSSTTSLAGSRRTGGRVISPRKARRNQIKSALPFPPA